MDNKCAECKEVKRLRDELRLYVQALGELALTKNPRDPQWWESHALEVARKRLNY